MPHATCHDRGKNLGIYLSVKQDRNLSWVNKTLATCNLCKLWKSVRISATPLNISGKRAKKACLT